uniref:BAH domain-containing protein n=1 Tax=Meloidogyne javanica TaxID=6303 RepID=A0A915MEJ1_MELJA
MSPPVLRKEQDWGDVEKESNNVDVFVRMPKLEPEVLVEDNDDNNDVVFLPTKTTNESSEFNDKSPHHHLFLQPSLNSSKFFNLPSDISSSSTSSGIWSSPTEQQPLLIFSDKISKKEFGQNMKEKEEKINKNGKTILKNIKKEKKEVNNCNVLGKEEVEMKPKRKYVRRKVKDLEEGKEVKEEKEEEKLIKRRRRKNPPKEENLEKGIKEEIKEESVEIKEIKEEIREKEEENIIEKENKLERRKKLEGSRKMVLFSSSSSASPSPSRAKLLPKPISKPPKPLNTPPSTIPTFTSQPSQFASNWRPMGLGVLKQLPLRRLPDSNEENVKQYFCFNSIRHKSESEVFIKLGDCVLGRVLSIHYEPSERSLLLTLLWFYTGKQLPSLRLNNSGCSSNFEDDELFASKHLDIVNADSVQGTTRVLTFSAYCRHKAQLALERLPAARRPPNWARPCPRFKQNVEEEEEVDDIMNDSNNTTQDTV